VDASDVKDQLKANTEEAIARGVFGVPTFYVDDKVFWGLDALPMMRAYLDGDQWFDRAWDAAASIQQGVKR
jgi:2-hydroxychromene-2-carboxylate isomerase